MVMVTDGEGGERDAVSRRGKNIVSVTMVMKMMVTKERSEQ